MTDQQVDVLITKDSGGGTRRPSSTPPPTSAYPW